MNVTGVIVEYNPFHNGHRHHVNETKQSTNADIIVAVMSGNFLQRGEPALVPKWNRTKMALDQGVDLVIELPYAYSTQHSETFANGAISILDSLGCHAICFGSESGQVDNFNHLFHTINDQQTMYNDYVKSYLKKGLSYPTALSKSALHFKNNENDLDLSLPNNILGFHYVKAIHQQHSSIVPYTIKRTQAQYHDKIISDKSIASATSIRHLLIDNSVEIDQIKHVVPQSTLEHLQAYLKRYKHFQDWERLFPFLKYKLITSTAGSLSEIYEAAEGLENRLLKYINDAENFSAFMHLIKTKRYTWTRLQRLCLHILTNTTKQEMTQVGVKCPYIRILGMNKKGRQFINERKKHIPVPLITTISQNEHPLIKMELRASRCYSLGFSPKLQNELLKLEYAHPPIIVNEEKS